MYFHIIFFFLIYKEDIHKNYKKNKQTKKNSYDMLPNTQSTDDIISIRISLEFYEVVLIFNNRT